MLCDNKKNYCPYDMTFDIIYTNYDCSYKKLQCVLICLQGVSRETAQVNLSLMMINLGDNKRIFN